MLQNQQNIQKYGINRNFSKMQINQNVDIQSKYKKLILTDISMKLALYFPILYGYSFITELMLGGKRRCFKVSVRY